MELLVRCYSISEDTESASIAKKAISSAGLDPKVKVICGGTDAANYNEKGIQTVVIGMGVQSEHTKDEKIAVAGMIKGVGIIQQIFKDFCE